MNCQIMAEPLKVTFDKNVYEFVVDPDKEGAIPDSQRTTFCLIHELILEHRILPFISETILTYEAVAKKERFSVLTDPKPILIQSEGTSVTVGSNPGIFPGSHAKDDIYLRGAIDMGFKILPGKRFGKLINPSIKSEWYYYLNEDYLLTSERFSNAVKIIEGLGAGYSQYIDLITNSGNAHLNSKEKLKQFQGNVNRLNFAIAEWSDGDSVALHIAYGIDFFCTKDEGKNARANATFGSVVNNELNERVGFKKGSPEELVKLLGGNFPVSS